MDGILNITDVYIYCDSDNGTAITGIGGEITINNSDSYIIKGRNIGISLGDYDWGYGSTLKVLSGTVIGSNYGIKTNSSHSKVFLGNADDGFVSKENPLIMGINGATFGYASSSLSYDVVMYDGRLESDEEIFRYTGVSYSPVTPDFYELHTYSDEYYQLYAYLVDIVDPTINAVITSKTSGNITVNVDATDVGEGIERYEYYYKNMSSSEEYQKIESTENICVIDNLEELTTYTLYAVVYDAEGNYATSDEVTVITNPKTVTGIEVKAPTKTEYEYGETLDLTGGTVCVVYDDGTKGNEVSLTSAMVSGYNATNPGQQTITVSYEGKTTTFEVTVKENPVISVESVSLNANTLNLKEGENATLTETITPNNASNKNVTWTSSDEDVATVSNGVVTAVSEGTVTITVTTEDGNKTASCIVTVEPRIISVESVSLNANTLNLIEGENATLTETITPNNASNKNVTWASSDNTVATVSNGVVTAVSAGTTTITVTTEDGNKTASCTVTVEPRIISVESVSLNTNTLNLIEGENATLTETITPNNASNKNVTWTSSDNAVATVSNGVVTAISAGTTTITVTTEDGNKTASCTVTVKEQVIEPEEIKVTSVTLDRETATITVGEASLVLTETVLPIDASNKNIRWTSSDERVATVENGVVTAVSKGTATITVITEDGNKTASCTVTVKEQVIEPEEIKVTGVTLDKQTATMKVGEASLVLKETVLPIDASNKNITWTSSDETIATVKNGVVTAISEGTATITVTTEDGNKTASCEVTVEEIQAIRVTGVTLNKQTANMKIDDILELIATILPEGANTELQWSSDNEEVATVDSTGKVTAIAEGEATITVTTTDGGYTAQCVVTVEKEQTGNTGNTGNNSNNSGSSSSTSSGVTSTDSTQATTKIPQTGISYAVMVAIILIITNGIVAYVRYKKSY